MLRWIRACRRRRKGVPTSGQVAANDALYRAECDRAVSEQREPEVAQAAAVLRQELSENHFAERIRLTMLGGA